MKRPGCLVLVAGLMLFGCGQKKEAAPAKPTNSTTSSGNPLTAPVDYLGAVGAAKKTAIKVIDTAYLSQQIQLFHEQEDRYPENLNELVTMHYLNALPAPPYGMKFSYDPQTGQLKVVRKEP
jgi:hypothetical protein